MNLTKAISSENLELQSDNTIVIHDIFFNSFKINVILENFELLRKKFLSKQNFLDENQTIILQGISNELSHIYTELKTEKKQYIQQSEIISFINAQQYSYILLTLYNKKETKLNFFNKNPSNTNEFICIFIDIKKNIYMLSTGIKKIDSKKIHDIMVEIDNLMMNYISKNQINENSLKIIKKYMKISAEISYCTTLIEAIYSLLYYNRMSGFNERSIDRILDKLLREEKIPIVTKNVMEKQFKIFSKVSMYTPWAKNLKLPLNPTEKDLLKAKEFMAIVDAKSYDEKEKEINQQTLVDWQRIEEIDINNNIRPGNKFPDYQSMKDFLRESKIDDKEVCTFIRRHWNQAGLQATILPIIMILSQTSPIYTTGFKGVISNSVLKNHSPTTWYFSHTWTIPELITHDLGNASEFATTQLQEKENYMKVVFTVLIKKDLSGEVRVKNPCMHIINFPVLAEHMRKCLFELKKQKTKDIPKLFKDNLTYDEFWQMLAEFVEQKEISNMLYPKTYQQNMEPVRFKHSKYIKDDT